MRPEIRSNAASLQTASLWSPIGAGEILFSSDFPSTDVHLVCRTRTWRRWRRHQFEHVGCVPGSAGNSKTSRIAAVSMAHCLLSDLRCALHQEMAVIDFY